jgi:glycosyltransferase involved in cell wall biosynthesis
VKHEPSDRIIRVLAFMEARSVTGPAKNLIGFAKRVRSLPFAAGPGMELSVVTFHRASAPPDRFLSALENTGIPTHVIRERFAGDPAIIRQLLHIVKSGRPDIIQTHNSKSHFLMRVTGLARRVPWIAFHHGFTTTNLKDKIHSHVARWAMKGATHIVTVCQAFSHDLTLSGIPASRISIQHNSVESFVRPTDEEVSLLRSQLGIPGDVGVVLAIGRLSTEKGHIDLIEGTALLRAADATAKFQVVIVGEGPERDVLESRLQTLGLSDHVILVGQQRNVRPYYAIADILVLPSHSEGSPNVLLEAMAAGVPIVATAVGGTVELVCDEKTALLVPSRDPKALSQAMGRLLQDRALADRLAAAAQAAARLSSPEAYTRSLLEIYAYVLVGRQRQQTREPTAQLYVE